MTEGTLSLPTLHDLGQAQFVASPGALALRVFLVGGNGSGGLLTPCRRMFSSALSPRVPSQRNCMEHLALGHLLVNLRLCLGHLNLVCLKFLLCCPLSYSILALQDIKLPGVKSMQYLPVSWLWSQWMWQEASMPLRCSVGREEMQRISVFRVTCSESPWVF